MIVVLPAVLLLLLTLLIGCCCLFCQERRVTPHVVVVREGEEGAELFDSLLIDDPDEPGSTSSTPDSMAEGGESSSPATQAPTGLEHFVQHIRAEVMMQLQP
jgi:hypothetical protein